MPILLVALRGQLNGLICEGRSGKPHLLNRGSQVGINIEQIYASSFTIFAPCNLITDY